MTSRPAFHSFASLLVMLAVLALPNESFAGPWTRSLGEHYTKLSVGGYFARGFRDASGTFQKGVKYRNISPALYGEVGVWKKLQLVAYVPYLAASNTYDNVPADRVVSSAERLREGNEYVRTSFGDVIVGAQWSSPWLAIPHALRVEAKLPLYNVNGPRGAEQGFFPAPGDGQLDFTLWASAGRSFDSLPLYLFAELGHMHRTEKYLVAKPELIDPVRGKPNYAETLRWFGQTGLKFAQDKYVMLNCAGAWPYQTDAFTKGWVNAGLGLYLPIGKRGLALEGSFDQAVHVKNSALGTAFSVGVSLSK